MKLIEKASFCLQNNLPFVLYAKPKETLLKGIFPKNKKLTIFNNQKGFVFVSFYKQTNVVFPSSDSVFFEEKINLEEKTNFNSVKLQFDETEKITFEKIIQKGIEEIEKGSFEKVVLSRKIKVTHAVAVFSSFKNLLIKHKIAFRYLWFHPEIGLWMGATPELLAKIKNNLFETVALAGTQVLSNQIIWHEKERTEQQLVTNYIKNQTEKFVQTLQISKAYSQKAGNLVHLKTDISGKLNQNISEIDIVTALHPTSAVCGMPLAESRKFILENENYNRKFYAGFLGEFQMHNETNLFVNLRCCEFLKNNLNLKHENPNQINLYVGCGITKESQPEKEFLETENKAKTILSVLVKCEE